MILTKEILNRYKDNKLKRRILHYCKINNDITSNELLLIKKIHDLEKKYTLLRALQYEDIARSVKINSVCAKWGLLLSELAECAANIEVVHHTTIKQK